MKLIQLLVNNAGVVELVDTPDLGSGAERCGGSSPLSRTTLLTKVAGIVSQRLVTSIFRT